MLTWERLTELLEYNPETGVFTRRVGWKGEVVNGYRLINKSTGKIYLQTDIDKKRYLMHRLAFFYTEKRWPHEVDHIDRDGTNNKRVNLRECTRSFNCANKKLRKDSTTGIKGVSRSSSKTRSFCAAICVDGKQRHLGSFYTAEEAGEAYIRAAREIFGEFARQE